MAQFRMPEELWDVLEPLLPPQVSKPHPLGCHRPRIPDRTVADVIWFVMRTGCQWAALDDTGICKHSVAHDRFQQWQKAGVFKRLWQEALQGYDCLMGIDWQWLCGDGVMTKAPLGEKKRPVSRRSRQTGHQALADHRKPRTAREPAAGTGQRA